MTIEELDASITEKGKELEVLVKEKVARASSGECPFPRGYRSSELFSYVLLCINIPNENGAN